MQHPETLRAAIEQATSGTITSMSIVHGGDVAASFDVTLADGRHLFAKTHPDPPPGFFSTEASGLEWLGAPDAVRVPHVVASSDGNVGTPAFLILDWIERGRPGARTDEVFGRELAELHDAGAACFGREDRATTGSRRLPNDPHDTWSAFYAECRLLPLARLAADAAALPPDAAGRLEQLAMSLDRFEDGAAPARLHGDLWAGNRLVDAAGESWLIDPAAHGGHREFDLAMMRLFGGFSEACFDAYEERHQLVEGWQDRVQLHQIAPLVVHAIKFGGRYVGAANAAIDTY
ncbi:fructosamine kinase family protein [soil metagenome]